MNLNLKGILGAILVLNFFICLGLMSSLNPSDRRFLEFNYSTQRFENAPKVSLYYSSAWNEYIKKSQFYQQYQKIKDDDNYCLKVANFRKENPIEFNELGIPIKNHRIIFSDYKPGNLVKNVARKEGILVLENHNIASSSSDLPLEELPPNINLFFHKTPSWHKKHKIDVHFLCEGQRYNHIPGNDHMVNKDLAAVNAKEYEKYYQGRKDCFDVWQFMPYTLLLYEQNECKIIMNYLLNDPNPDEIKWIKKKARNSHNADGVQILNRERIEKLLQRYDYGKKCGGNDKTEYIIQKYISNPLLVNGKKFDFRVYMLIANMDPLIIFYHDGFLRVSMIDYNVTAKEDGAHITNTALYSEILNKRNATFGEYKKAMKDQMWTFRDFEEYMRENNLVSENWIEDYVRPTMKEKMLHLTRMNLEKLLPHKRVFELFGVDFMFDNNLHLWFLEVNRSPAFQATTPEKGKIQSKLIKDTFKIEYALLYNGNLDEIIANSEFEKVYDGRLAGIEKYQGLISEDCI